MVQGVTAHGSASSAVLTALQGQRNRSSFTQHVIYRITSTNHCYTHHVSNFEISIGEDYGIRGGGNRQHEGK